MLTPVERRSVSAWRGHCDPASGGMHEITREPGVLRNGLQRRPRVRGRAGCRRAFVTAALPLLITRHRASRGTRAAIGDVGRGRASDLTQSRQNDASTSRVGIERLGARVQRR